jgi:hypothetical protein
MNRVFAILRYDSNIFEICKDIEQSVVFLKAIEGSREDAEAEVKRLSNLNRNSKYWFQEISLGRLKVNKND